MMFASPIRGIRTRRAILFSGLAPLAVLAAFVFGGFAAPSVPSKNAAADAAHGVTAATTLIGAKLADYGPPPPLPVNEYVSYGGYTSCIQPQVIEARFYAPQESRSRIIAIGGVNTNNACGGDSAEFELQTKVCGGWGCNWRTMDHARYSKLPGHGYMTSRLLTTGLRKGSNSYRVVVTAHTFGFDAEDNPEPGIFGWVPETEQFFGPAYKFSS